MQLLRCRSVFLGQESRRSKGPIRLTKPCQKLLLSSDGVLHEKAHKFVEQADDEISMVKAKLERVGAPEKGQFNDIWSARKAYRRYLNAMDVEGEGDEDHESRD